MFQRQEDQEFIEEHLENGQVKKYIKGRTLGKGGFAECYELVSQETGKRYAAKVIDKESLSKGKTKEKLQSEILIHKALRHRNIVKFQHFFEDHQFVYILLELCSNNTLNELLKRRKVLTELEVRYYILQLLHALSYIHQQRVIHRDLKLGNFFLDDSLHLKVGDFGLATSLTHNNQRRRTMCGTPNYIAPEILQSKKGHSYEVDIWSTGVITYALLFGKPPFETSEVKLTYEKIKNCDFTFPKSNTNSQPAKNFISRMLILNPADRATVDELLAHPFLVNQDIPKALPRSTLACPPSKAFIEQLKSDPKMLIDSEKEDEHEFNINSSRTSKHSSKCKMSLPTTHIIKSELTRQPSRPELPHQHPKTDLVHLYSKSRKSERSQGSITRSGSGAIGRKTALSGREEKNQEKQVSGCISFFEEQSKYGMFYRLSRGMIGMRFNDQSCLVSNCKFTKFRYVMIQNNVQTEMEMFEGGQEPEQLQKKMKIITHFAKALAPKYESQNEPKNPLNKLKDDSLPSSLYLVFYYNTNQSTLFCFNNGLHQVKFKDQTDLIIDAQNVTYTTRQKKKITFKASHVGSQDEQIKTKYNHVNALIKRLKRIKTIATEDKKNKENPQLMQSSSQAKLSKGKDIKQAMPKRQFSSSTNLNLNKKPLFQHTGNSYKAELARKEKIF